MTKTLKNHVAEGLIYSLAAVALSYLVVAQLGFNNYSLTLLMYIMLFTILAVHLKHKVDWSAIKKDSRNLALVKKKEDEYEIWKLLSNEKFTVNH